MTVKDYFDPESEKRYYELFDYCWNIVKDDPRFKDLTKPLLFKGSLKNRGLALYDFTDNSVIINPRKVGDWFDSDARIKELTNILLHELCHAICVKDHGDDFMKLWAGYYIGPKEDFIKTMAYSRKIDMYIALHWSKLTKEERKLKSPFNFDSVCAEIKSVIDPIWSKYSHEQLITI